MTGPVSKTSSESKKRVSVTKKTVAQKSPESTTRSTSNKQTVSDSNKQPASKKSVSKTIEDLNSQDYPLHPERIWPD